MAYIDEAMLRDAVALPVFVQFFDDDGDGNVPSGQSNVALVIQRAHALVTSYLVSIYKASPPELPDPVAVLLQTAELDYALMFTFDRRPELTKSGWKAQRDAAKDRADRLMQNIQSGDQGIADNDNPPEPTPQNSGGLVYDRSVRMIIDSADGTRNGGDF